MNWNGNKDRWDGVQRRCNKRTDRMWGMKRNIHSQRKWNDREYITNEELACFLSLSKLFLYIFFPFVSSKSFVYLPLNWNGNHSRNEYCIKYCLSHKHYAFSFSQQFRSFSHSVCRSLSLFPRFWFLRASSVSMCPDSREKLFPCIHFISFSVSFR